MSQKKFDEYNSYQDRGIVKWQTAFALGELVSTINQGNQVADYKFKKLPQQSQEEIEGLLELSIKENKVLEVQLNTLDDFGGVKESIFGTFLGMAGMDRVQLGAYCVDFCDIRNIKAHDFHKWSDVSQEKLASVEDTEVKVLERASSSEYFEDGFWIE